jgi:hypothetical protein
MRLLLAQVHAVESEESSVTNGHTIVAVTELYGGEVGPGESQERKKV